jgi:hypothetical protein
MGLQFAESTLLEEVPQETVSIRRSDFPILIKDQEGGKRLVLLEVQSRWDRRLPIRLLDYLARYVFLTLTFCSFFAKYPVVQVIRKSCRVVNDAVKRPPKHYHNATCDFSSCPRKRASSRTTLLDSCFHANNRTLN